MYGGRIKRELIFLDKPLDLTQNRIITVIISYSIMIFNINKLLSDLYKLHYLSWYDGSDVGNCYGNVFRKRTSCVGWGALHPARRRKRGRPSPRLSHEAPPASQPQPSVSPTRFIFLRSTTPERCGY